MCWFWCKTSCLAKTPTTPQFPQKRSVSLSSIGYTSVHAWILKIYNPSKRLLTHTYHKALTYLLVPRLPLGQINLTETDQQILLPGSLSSTWPPWTTVPPHNHPRSHTFIKPGDSKSALSYLPIFPKKKVSGRLFSETYSVQLQNAFHSAVYSSWCS